MADGKLYIIVTDQLPGGSGPLTPDKSSDTNKDKENALADFAKHKFFNLIESQAKQAVNYTISNIGNFTGNYVSQTHVQDAKQVLDTFINLGMSAFAGFKMTGSPWGAVIAAGVSLVGSGISQIEQLYAGYVENAKINRQISQLRTRAGLNSTNNGSRGTDQ